MHPKIPCQSSPTPTLDDQKTSKQMHIVMFPWLAFGHMIPYLELSKFIAQNGHKISFISTPRNIQRLPKLPPILSSLIDLVPLKLPHVSEIPENAEATMDIVADDVHYLKKAYDGLEPEFTQFLKGSEAVDWVIHDFSAFWVPPIAKGLGIGSIFYSIVNGFFQGFLGPASMLLDLGSDPRKELIEFTVPPEWVHFPTKVAFRLYEIKRLFSGERKTASGVPDPCRVGLTITRCDAIAIRHCREFEPEWLTLLEEQNQKTVIPLGLMPPSMQENVDENNKTWEEIKSWLDTQKSKSVIYVALGSESPLSQEELTELALGLELSGLPFFLVLRKPPGTTESTNTVKLPENFKERVKELGVVWVNWVPQLNILSHESVGGFLTHCGWGSVIEGLQHGLPLIMLPLMVDQGLNARVLEDKKVGIEIPRNETDGTFDKNAVAESLRYIMVEKEGLFYKKKAEEMMAIFGDRRGQDRYLHSFLEYLGKNKRLHKDQARN